MTTHRNALILKPTSIVAAFFAAAGLVALTPVAQAQASQPPAGGEFGRVISSTAVVQQVTVPKQVCTPGQEVESHGSGAGAAIGAIAGGALGQAIGHGNGKAAATGLGMLGGAIVGSMIGSGSRKAPATCTTQNTFESRTVAYNVLYEYAGKQYQTQMDKDPGAWVPLQIQPMVSGATAGNPGASQMVESQISTQTPSHVPAPVIVSPIAVAPVHAYPVYSHPPVAYSHPPVVYSQPAVVWAPPVVHQRSILSISTPIVISRHVQPAPRVVVVHAPAQVHVPAPVHVVHHRNAPGHRDRAPGHHAPGHGRGHATTQVHHVPVQVHNAPAPVLIEAHRPSRGNRVYVAPDAAPAVAPAYNHIKEGRGRSYY